MNDVERLELLFVIGVVDDEGVGERERREIGDRERERDEPDDVEDFDDDDDDDRLIDAFILCSHCCCWACLDDEVEPRSASAFSERGMVNRFSNDNVLKVCLFVYKNLFIYKK